ncbi:50S ribosomal protein L30 [Candidatus Methanomassiliicoccus intestinalis]|jgi:ribosomal protein L30P|uniref:Large ribosomal subunit protein uL30 n=2 Tax=Candidatus Methanomassiliicoccus intestinalis TaxID=1406512 RepID=R9T536_METII|nr:50S ribosomal protein L30 [Candidatus Methanomassiliicoccus intestinalis]AGN25835.1 50S ribosomal protein L30P [Candidatus Methanomassiliicoccus intestinalis Issoire-Mx1]TQS81165.1 MAG: 50S ribosomal protein L30 [Candidatus Methanomassiliicoccus intestinalis]TQS83254.1 MAG: 50S ribosomal protein L30 [Candidatus Methanomassiliicoccus intestinalis]
MAFAVIRVRGHKNINKDIEDTMNMLRLTRINHCVIIPENAVMKGMLQKSKDFITWGEVSEETLAKMIKVRGKLMGDKPIDDEYVSQNSQFSSVDEFAKSVVNDEVKYASLKDVKPIFRLHPPRQGYEAVKKDVKTHGSLGYRGASINVLIEKML